MTTNDTTGGVLRGVRVAEFGQYIPGRGDPPYPNPRPARPGIDDAVMNGVR